jgi:uncharacterized protein YndB with AHSA1/START domain
MPTARASRTIAAPAEDLWRVISDPHHLPRWWPRVTRVEDVGGDAFTEVMKTSKGKTVRADFDVVAADVGARTVRWDQRIEGTPFAAVLRSSQTELTLLPVAADGVPGGGPPAGSATEVTIEMRQVLAGQTGRDGWYTAVLPRVRERMVRRAAAATIAEALDGLERISV